MIVVPCLLGAAAFLWVALVEWRAYGRASAIIPSIIAVAFVAAALV